MKSKAILGAFGAATAAVMVLSGCGGGKTNTAASANATASSSASGSAPQAAASGAANARAGFQAYTACLQQHGAPVPTFRPDFSGSPRPSRSGNFSRPPGGGRYFGSASANPTFQAAMQACASLRPQGGLGGFGGRRQISATTFAAFKSCMSDNGVTITATDAQQGIRGLNRSDPKTAAALKVCQPILGQGGAPPSPNPVASPTA